MKRICVIGSMNVDLTVSMDRFHLPGETIIGNSFATYTGGKGGNQAVALARLGAAPLMVGRLGKDDNGDMYLRTLEAAGVDCRGIVRDGEAPSGVALIEVDATGENRIAVVSGTNMRVDRAQVDQVWPLLMEYDIFLLQLELPMDTIGYVVGRLHGAGKTVILDPAPAAELADQVVAAVAYMTPNERELGMLSGMPAASEEEAVAAARSLIGRGTRAVVCKRGRSGSMLVTAEETVRAPGFVVKTVDTTAAGDSFNAGFAVALAQGMQGVEALRFANAVGALSTTAAGAQGAMPTMAQVEALLAEG